MLDDSLSDIIEGVEAFNVSALPIAKYESLIVDTVRRNQVTIVFGDTGSGKTTQIPQYLFRAGLYDRDRMIAITQPRRIAAISMARRVAEEMKCSLGIEVGYEVRFDRKCCTSTKIKYMTDGTLLNCCLSDRNLNDYSVIIVDEAHERSIHTDVLLGLLKRILERRRDLKIIITSATIKTEKFSDYFDGAPVIKFEGRLYPVEVEYRKDCYAFVEDSVDLVKEIHNGKEIGDILVFLTGQEDIEKCCEQLDSTDGIDVYPLYGSMDCDIQQKVFKKVNSGQRKVVVATNIAETTITIDGIKFVVDCGFVKQNTYNGYLGIEVLEQKFISKAQADQRKGRAGRTSNGRCYRLYSEFAYDMADEEAEPEIRRMNLCEIYLKLLAVGLSPMEFQFLDPPDRDSLVNAESELQELDLLDDRNNLTELGRSMSDLPVDPILGKVLMSSSEYHCTRDMVTILSMMTEKNIVKRINNQQRSQEVKGKFYHSYGDHLAALNIFNDFMDNDKSRTWCYDNYLNYDKLMKVYQVREQLLRIMNNKNVILESLPGNGPKDPIRNAIIKGYYRNICYSENQGKYIRYLDSRQLFIHPGSCLFKDKPKLILYHEVMQTDKAYMHGIMKLDESVLKNFPNEMKKISFKSGAVPSRRKFI